MGPAIPPAGLLDALRELREALPVPVAPHVAAHLVRSVGVRPADVVETARLLSPSELAGGSLIADPLPAASGVHDDLAGSVDILTPTDREILLVASVSVVDRTDVLLRAVGTDIDSLVASRSADHLEMVAGHVRIVDPRVRSVIHAGASMTERTAAHRRLAAVHTQDGNRDAATWHTALSTLAGDPGLAADLLRVARRMVARGEAVWAQRVAREATAHARGAQRGEALGVAGVAALHAGHVVDAVDLLGEAVRTAGSRQGLLGPLLVAVTLATGQVPDDLTAAAGSSREALLTAVLHAERSDVGAAQRLLDVTSGVLREDPWQSLVQAAVHLLAGSVDESLDLLDTRPAEHGTTAALAQACRALSLAGADRFEDARSVLTRAAAELAPLREDTRHERAWASPACTRQAVTPLVEAYLRVAGVLVETWAGTVGTANQDLLDAAGRLPVALPLSGLAVVLAGRLELFTQGAPGELAASLERLLPLTPCHPVRTGLLVNRAIASCFAGEHELAATLLDLADEQPAGAAGLPLPGFEAVEVWTLAGRPDAARAALARLRARPEARWTSAAAATRARAEVTSAAAGDRHALAGEVLALGRSLRSPLEQGRTRLAVARALLTDGPGHGRAAGDHLRAAGQLFEEAGAGALAELARGLGERTAHDRVPVRRGEDRRRAGLAGHGRDPGDTGAPGLVWSACLTPREREVAQVVAAGASNREAAAALSVSVRTIEVHLTRVFRKLGTCSRLELAVLVNRAGG
ncbi:helix-turn-helix transcriptional regulator [Actinotalea sp. K2]|uniref:LuxR C-terminal-related transcriptional regulator n=1 Tax=Actinotalea sp. K2 TaxID=2939438 RepID=UPI0020181AEF|nr:helix-turn-helix transcriptional regulator [Actinotalea sp. K2]MCL3859390.1 helix-turn-helix transcriptional regulator [Actinotalea sp. K2]